jgi:hypothetical protein
LAYYVEAILIRDFRKGKAAFTVGQWFRALNEIYAVSVDIRGCEMKSGELRLMDMSSCG